MKKIKLFVDSSVNPQAKVGFGAFLEVLWSKEYKRIKELADMQEYHQIADIIDERVPNGEFKGGFDFEKYHNERIKERKNV